ncbi:MAG: 16S rRNA (cytosine(967)-C(5))-methyltransferase RsmB [Clostridiales bacterium]|nr:16S rRNA (cytosine(967)-C(5))-methyltransferase RsmB [Clostridiales bacterium]
MTGDLRPAEAPVERTGLSQGARRVALDVLRAVHEKGAYASLALQEHLTRAKLSPADRRLATSIVYSTLEQQIQIDFALDRLMDHPTGEPVQRDILRLSACQILFHDRVPDSAAVNEGVNLARALGMEGAAGFLNAVLRNLVRGKAEIPWPKREDDLRAYLHVMGSMPMWLVDRLIAAHGEEMAEAIILYRGQNHEMVVRPNLMKLSDAAFETLLSGKAWSWRRGLAPHAYLIGGASEIALDNDYRAGNFSIQGQSSILAAEAIQAKPGMRVLDACAAPGGKACYMAEAMQGTGRVYAWELHEKRVMLLESAKRRLQLDNLRISQRDAAEPKPDFDGMMDAVLLDAPCTGLGVLTEKPDLKYRLREEDIQAIVASQQTLLETLCAYVRPGGTLVYSTCSILPEENELQVQAFLQRHPEYAILPPPDSYPEAIRQRHEASGLQLFAHRDGVEGFYIARMRRERA